MTAKIANAFSAVMLGTFAVYFLYSIADLAFDVLAYLAE